MSSSYPPSFGVSVIRIRIMLLEFRNDMKRNPALANTFRWLLHIFFLIADYWTVPDTTFVLGAFLLLE